MQPIQELLSRIRWDPKFCGAFEIAFVDHMSADLQRVALREIRFGAGNGFSFELIDPHGQWVSIPFHRIRRVYRDGELIWSRRQA